MPKMFRIIAQIPSNSLELCKKRVFEPYISTLVLNEIQFAKAPLRKKLEDIIRHVKPVLLPILSEEDHLSNAFVREKAVPPSKPEDARHVAIALLEGYHHSLRIVSPKELIYYEETS